jgi:hypothetical protein
VFIPETGFRFKKGSKEILLFVSLACKQVLYDLGDQKMKLDIDPSIDNFVDYIDHLSAKS